ncbi:MAG: prepilin-type N-terminal cleavage/methylation domain-containing protein [bacterium]|nr:prepilin-type N-terminal cleavage/methylation domain-containing protein [bacterium]
MGASRQKAQESPGFTIPELLVSIFIIVLMTAITLPNWHAGETTLALDRAAHKLAQDLRKATELAQRAQFYDCDPSGTLGYKITGYGIYIPAGTSTSYTLYVECNGNEIYDGPTVDAVFQSVTLENKIQITSAGRNPFSILFVPPVPTITIQPGSLTEAQITLSVAGDLSRFKIITITTKGIIEID